MKARKRQTAVKGRFSAMMISAAVHVAVLIAAGTFVAVTVVQRQEARFEGRQVSRPKMQLQRLQVPQRARMERQAPQMSQRVTAQAVTTRSVDFQMPEIAGLGGGINVDMSGAGFTGSLGFATPQLNLFGLRSQGEKVVFILDTTRPMLVDEIGGVRAYEIIKNELIQMIERLPPTSLFNVVIFEFRENQAFSEELVQPTRDMIEKLKKWIGPLNEDKRTIGLQTLAHPGIKIEFEPMAPIPNTQYGWICGLSYAIQHGVDTVYWLGTSDYIEWIHPRLYADAKRGRSIDPPSGQPPELAGSDFDAYPGGEERWNEIVARARQLHEEENERRRAAGQPERVLMRWGGENALVQTYLPGTPIPVQKWRGVGYEYESKDIVEYVQNMLSKYRSQDGRDLRTGVRRDQRFSFNVIHFVPVNQPPGRLNRVVDAARALRGEYLQIRGMEAIQSATSGR